jgi:hypothetical protein
MIYFIKAEGKVWKELYDSPLIMLSDEHDFPVLFHSQFGTRFSSKNVVIDSDIQP